MTTENRLNDLEEIATLLERATDRDLLMQNDLEVIRDVRSINLVPQTQEIKFTDIPTKLNCAKIKVTYRENSVRWVTVDLYAGYKSLTEKQQGLILANIYHYARDFSPSISFYFNDSIDNEKEHIFAFGNFVRRQKPELYRALESVFIEVDKSS